MPRKATVECKAKGCSKDARAKGYCDTHYRRWKKYGDALAPDQRLSPEHGKKAWNTRRANAVSEGAG